MKIIGVGGLARAGKDTFVSIARSVFEKNGYNTFKFAFADLMKKEIEIVLKNNNFPIDIYNCTGEEKERLRPLMVWWGCARRQYSTQGLYWVNHVNKLISKLPEDERTVIFISDVRFQNEANWLKDVGGVFIHLKKYNVIDGRDGYGDTIETKKFDVPPNEEEAKNDPIIASMADVGIEWENKTGKIAIEDADLRQVVLDTLNLTKFFKHTSTGILTA
jgi:hypothetical protein